MPKSRRHFLTETSLGLLGASEEGAITPIETICLFNGKDLNSFYTWLTDFKYEDPHRDFTIVEIKEGQGIVILSPHHQKDIRIRL